MAKKYKPVALIILDGFGIWREERGNPILLAKTPNLDMISRFYPGTALEASGIAVGLPWGERGNSEVGHVNIGAGMVVYQVLPRIQFTLQDQSFFKMKLWEEMMEHAKNNNGAIHLMGLLSDGGIHSHIDHLLAILESLKIAKCVLPVFIHVFTDGQDVPAQSALNYLQTLENEIKNFHSMKVATLMGRRYAMDKALNWSLTRKAFECLTQGKGQSADDARKAVENAYKNGLNDELIEPTVIVKKGLIKNGDAVLFFNFRPDRARQLTEIFLKSGLKNLFFVTMAEYNKDYPVKVAFPPQIIANPLAKVVSDAGKKQFHIAETEKYAHVTYFLNGGIEKPFPREERVIIESLKSENYAQKPEMSAYGITDRVLNEIEKSNYDFFAVNFANTDIIGHSGNFDSAIKAVETVDECLGKIVKAVLDKKGAILITADHGNVEEMINLGIGKIDTEHSTNPVPCWIITPDNKTPKKEKQTPDPINVSNNLADVAPTVLELMNIKKPAEMTGNSLIKNEGVLILR